MAKEDIKQIKQILEDYKEETKRHFDVVAEDLRDEIKLLAEQVTANTEKIEVLTEQVAANTEKLQEHDMRFDKVDERLNKVDERLNKVDETLEIIKFDIEFIKDGLKQKVDQDEFMVLERRVSILEAKSNK